MRARWPVAALLAAVSAAAPAGTPCSDAPRDPEATRRSFTLAVKAFRALEESGAAVAIIGRVGSDLSRYGLRYSHAGLAWRDHPKGRWLVVHVLNECGTAVSRIYDEGLANFFSDAPFAYEAVAVFPADARQRRLAAALRSALPARLHEPAYNMVAYPWSIRYQNSNQWLVEVIAAASAPPGSVLDRAQAQAWLKASGYAPSLLRIGALERLGGRVLQANIAFDDHPDELRFSGRIHVASVESVVAFLERLDPGARKIVLGLD